MISLEKWYILTRLQKLPENVGDLGKLINVKGYKKLPKVQLIAQSGHTDHVAAWTTLVAHGTYSFLFLPKVEVTTFTNIMVKLPN